MNVCKRLYLLACVLAALVSSGCVQSEQPLSDAKSSKLDSRAIGRWEYKSADETTRFTIKKKDGDENVLEFIVDPTPKEPAKSETAYAYTSKIGDDYYASLVDSDAANPGYTIVRYDVVEEGKGLKIYGVKSQVFEDAIKSGQLAGKFEGDFIKSVKLTATTEALTEFYKTNRDRIFSDQETIVFKKIE